MPEKLAILVVSSRKVVRGDENFPAVLFHLPLGIVEIVSQALPVIFTAIVCLDRY